MELTIEQALRQGAAAHGEGKLQDAERLYRAILQSQPLHPDANHNLGVLAVSVNKVAEALPLFKTALEANPNVEQFWLSYIEALIKEQDYNTARQVVLEGKKQGFPGNKLNVFDAQLTSLEDGKAPPQAQLDSLLEYYHVGRYGDAEKLALSITQEFPEHPSGWQVLGAVLKQTGRVDESVVVSQNSIRVAPQDPHAHNNLGVMLKDLGKLEEAEACYRQAITLRPDYAEAHFNMANTLKALGNLEEAKKNYTQAITLKPDYIKAHNNLGNVLQELGRSDEAEASYRQAIALKPDYAEAYNNLGSALREQGKLKEAFETFKNALSINPNYDEIYHNLGTLLREQGKLEDAIKIFDMKKNKGSIAEALECLYFLEKYHEFNLRLDSIIKREATNIRVAAISAFAAHQLQQKDTYPFCSNAIELVKISHLKNHISDTDSFIKGILHEMNEKNSIWEPLRKTTKGGFQTNSKIFYNSSENMKYLEKIIKNELELFKEQFNSKGSLLFQKWPDKIKINAWYVRMFKSGYQDSHIHPDGWVSGVLYLKTVESPISHEGAIEFGLHGYGYPVKNKDYPRRIHQPYNGELVLFPSSLFHRTIPIIKDVERCVIAFDLVK